MQQAVYATTPQKTSVKLTDRLDAIDMVRGLAMIFMLLNHATWHIPGVSFRVNFGWEFPLPPLPFLNPYTWIGMIQGTPLFFAMAGFSVALFEQSRRRRGWTEWQITRFLLVRGCVLIAVDWLLLPIQFYPHPDYSPSAYFVLTSIGICMWFVAIIRLLPLSVIVVLIVSVSVGVQAAYKMVVLPLAVNLVRSIFLYMSPFDPIDFGFPVLPWLCVILLGYVTMRYVEAHPRQFAWVALGIALVSWCLWFILNRFNDFGILFPLHPLLMTKHPPSLGYLTFYISVTYLLLAVLRVFQSARHHFPFNRIAVLGQTALSFYILHFYVIDIFSALLHDLPVHPVITVFLITLLSLPVLYLLCTRYLLIRRAYPHSLLKYL